MIKLNGLKVQYVTDADGRKVAVQVPVEQFDELMEDIEDLAAVAERRDEPTVDHHEFLEALRRDGLLQD